MLFRKHLCMLLLCMNEWVGEEESWFPTHTKNEKNAGYRSADGR